MSMQREGRHQHFLTFGVRNYQASALRSGNEVRALGGDSLPGSARFNELPEDVAEDKHTKGDAAKAAVTTTEEENDGTVKEITNQGKPNFQWKHQWKQCRQAFWVLLFGLHVPGPVKALIFVCFQHEHLEKGYTKGLGSSLPSGRHFPSIPSSSRATHRWCSGLAGEGLRWWSCETAVGQSQPAHRNP
mmetsp:Transcript_56440/g.131501  ORF Transcript_56440/g.131501 Transcript_56440/m.131501 type:complete len:188 (-) Transcript_56440:91-654(-)